MPTQLPRPMRSTDAVLGQDGNPPEPGLVLPLSVFQAMVLQHIPEDELVLDGDGVL